MALTFDFIKDISQGLSDLAKKDKKYKSIVDQLRNLLSQTQGEFLSFEQNHQLLLKRLH